MEMENEFVEFDKSVKRNKRDKAKRETPPIPEVSENITMYEYLASSVPADAHFVMNKYGRYRKARDERELEYQLKNFVRTFGEKGLRALAEIHPDRNLLELDCENCKVKDEDYTNLLNNWNFQSQAQPSYYNASGSNPQSELMAQKLNTSMIVMGGFILMGVALMFAKQK